MYKKHPFPAIIAKGPEVYIDLKSLLYWYEHDESNIDQNTTDRENFYSILDRYTSRDKS